MASPKDIDHLLEDWPYEPGEISVRLICASGGRDVLQMRVEMGILQLEVEHRPDGQRPGGADTYFDYLVGMSTNEGDSLVLSEEQCNGADEEFMQFYQRRLCWLALKEYLHAVRDADHNLAFMDFVRKHSPSDQWTWSHEQYRPFILFHRTQAAALAALDESGPQAAIEQFNQGLTQIESFFEEHGIEEQYKDDEMAGRLIEMRESLRDHYSVGRTLGEQLAAAVAKEQYELAAKLRDKITRDEPRGT